MYQTSMYFQFCFKFLKIGFPSLLGAKRKRKFQLSVNNKFAGQPDLTVLQNPFFFEKSQKQNTVFHHNLEPLFESTKSQQSDQINS